MKRFKWILIPALAAAGLMAVVYYSGQRRANEQITTVREKSQPVSGERIFGKDLRELSRFVYPGAAVREWAWYSDELYILDGQTQRLQVIDSTGRVVREQGHAGEAPWENRQTQHLWVDDEGYATIDNAHMVVKKYSSGDALMYYGKVKTPIWDGVYMGNRQFFLLDDEARDPSFFTVNAVTGTTGPRIPLVSLLKDVPESDYLNVVYEGQVLRGGQKILYMCARTGKFFVFDADGEYLYTGTTIDDTPPPVVTARSSGNVTYYVREPDLNTNYSGTADEDYLYILSLIAWKNTSTLSVDAYDLNTGQYTWSMSVPNAGEDLPVEILKGGKDLFVLYEGNQVIRYAMD